jgi:hypothetical protein
MTTATTSTTSLQDILDFIDSPDDFDLIIDEDGRESTVKFIDDYGLSCGSNSMFFLAGFEFGATHLIHASSWEAAYEAFIDETEPIPVSELAEAYGVPDSPEMEAWKETHPAPPYYQQEQWKAWCEALDLEEKRVFKQWGDDADARLREHPDLIEGYQYQSNSTGTGIVELGHYFWQREDDLSQITIQRKEKEKV